MPQYGVAITKHVSFRGVNQDFSNVYHYNGPALNASSAAQLAADIKALEVPWHSTDVTFNYYRVWSSGASAGSNNMINQGPLSGTGSSTTNTSMDRERAILVRFAAGFDSRGKPVFLRKWFHSCGGAHGVGFAAAALQQTAEIPSGNRTTFETQAANFLSVTSSSNVYNLVAESGRAGGTPVVAHRYLEHHQLGDAWR